MEEPFTLVVADDDPDTVRILVRTLEQPDCRVVSASNGREALAHFESGPVHLVVTDLMMPGMDGMALTREIKNRHPEVPVIIVTAFGSVETAVEAMRAGAHDYITKPIVPEELRIKTAKALDQVRMRAELCDLKRRVSGGGRPPTFLIGESPAWRKVLDLINLVSIRDVPVILEGESGTGKEVVARAIHERSRRAERPFVPLNCAALPETLLESELFGYQKGAFTGAVANKRGLMEEADKATLFLDEVVATPVPIQIKLLRALQEGEIRRLGSTQTVAVDVRVICASNRRIQDEIAAGRFREDLFYRLAVFTIRLPSLRERGEDIPLLADFFVNRYRDSLNPKVSGLDRGAREWLRGYDWPGNVRQLENFIRRGLVVCRSRKLTEEDLHQPADEGVGGAAPAAPAGGDFAEAQGRFNREYFANLMRRHRGKIQAVAAEAGISRKNVYEYLKRAGLDPQDFRRA